MRQRFRFLALLLCCLFICGGALAAPGDTVLYPYDFDQEPLDENGEEVVREYVESAAVMPDGVYAITGGKIIRWQPGDEAPKPFLTLPEAPGYYQAYDAETDEEMALSEEEMEALEGAIHQLVPGDDGLYGLNLYTLGLARVAEEGLTFLPEELQMPPLLKPQSEYAGDLREIRGAFVQEGTLVLLLGSEQENDWDSNYLYLVDLAGGDLRLPDASLRLRMAAPYRDGQILVGVDSAATSGRRGVDLAVLSLDTAALGETLQSGVTRDWYQMGGFAYQPGTDAVYFLGESQVQRLDLKTGEKEGFAFLPTSSVSPGSACGILEGGYYVVQDYRGIYVRNLDPEYKVSRALRINGAWENDAYQSFVREHPDIPVLLQQEDRYGSEDIADAIQSGESQTDLFTTSSYAGLATLIQKGYAGDLSGSEKLRGAVEAMYPQIQEALMDEQGQLLAFPENFSLSPMRVNVTLFEEHFPGEELPETWEQFLTLYVDFAARGEEDVAFLDYYADPASLVYMIINHFILQYETPDTPVDFLNPVLRDALAMAAELPNESILTEDGRQMTREEMDQMNAFYARKPIFESYAGMFEDSDYLARIERIQEVSADGGMIIHERYGGQDGDDPDKVYDEYRLITPPVFEPGQTPVVEGYLSVFMLNPKSDNQDLALMYLEAYADTMEISSRYGMRPDLSEPVRPRYYESNRKWDEKYLKEMRGELEKADEENRRSLEEEIGRTEANMENAEQTDWEISEKAIEAYREIAPYMKIAAGSIFSYSGGEGAEQIHGLMDRYNSGQMQLDAFLRELDGKARMIYLEGQ